MKENKLFIPTIIIAIGLSILGFFGYKGLKSLSDKDRVITVKGLSEQIVVANDATLTLKYVIGGNDMNEILQQINKNNSIIEQYILSKNISKSDIFFDTPSIKDKANQEYDSDTRNIKYRYYTTVKATIHSKNVTAVRQAELNRSDLLSNGINLVPNDYYDNPKEASYTLTNLNTIKPQLISSSIKAAYLSAEEFAKSSSAKIGSIKSASQGQIEIEPTQDPLKLKIRVVSTIVYFLK